MSYEAIQEPLDEEERELMDPDNWDWENAYDVEPGPDPHLIFQVRLSGEDRQTSSSALLLTRA